MVRYLNESEIRSLLTMPATIDCVERAFVDRARGLAVDVPRRRTRQPGGHLHIVQGAAPELGLIGYKAYYSRAGGGRSFLVHLLDHATAAPVAILEAEWMGQMRTGAATGVAARHLSRADSAVVGLFGTGRHAMTQLEATCAVRHVREVKVHGRDAGRVQRFCDEMAARVNARLRPATDAADAVRDSDIVVAMTRADAPLFDGRLLEPGQFISAAGANALNRRELDLAAVRRAEVIVVDSVQVAEGECGDLLQAFEAGLLQWENVPTLGDVIVGRHPGRESAGQVVLYESHGMALQDLYTAAHVLALARERGVGIDLPIGA